MLRYINDVQVFWDYEFENMIWDVFWWVFNAWCGWDLNYANYQLENDMLNCLCFMRKYVLKTWSRNVNV
jgi:hypothetical protein